MDYALTWFAAACSWGALIVSLTRDPGLKSDPEFLVGYVLIGMVTLVANLLRLKVGKELDLKIFLTTSTFAFWIVIVTALITDELRRHGFISFDIHLFFLGLALQATATGFLRIRYR